MENQYCTSTQCLWLITTSPRPVITWCRQYLTPDLTSRGQLRIIKVPEEHIAILKMLIVARLSKSLATLTLGSSKINQHCWRFHGSGVIAAPQIIGLISFCTGMHHGYFLRSPMCFRVPHLWSKIHNWTGEFATVIWRLHCFTVSFRGDVRGESGPR